MTGKIKLVDSDGRCSTHYLYQQIIHLVQDEVGTKVTAKFWENSPSTTSS